MSVAFGLTGCSSGGSPGGGCTKETECKGDRVCASGQCVEQPSTAASDMPGAQLDPRPSPQPNPPPQTPFPPASP